MSSPHLTLAPSTIATLDYTIDGPEPEAHRVRDHTRLQHQVAGVPAVYQRDVQHFEDRRRVSMRKEHGARIPRNVAQVLRRVTLRIMGRALLRMLLLLLAPRIKKRRVMIRDGHRMVMRRTSMALRIGIAERISNRKVTSEAGSMRRDASKLESGWRHRKELKLRLHGMPFCGF
jgi:hypothetical protein